MFCKLNFYCIFLQIVLLVVRSIMKLGPAVQRLVLILTSCVLVRVSLVAPVLRVK